MSGLRKNIITRGYNRKLSNTIWPLAAILAGGLILRRRAVRGTGYVPGYMRDYEPSADYLPGYHPADLYSEQDVADYQLFLESGYGKGFTEAELAPWERNRWRMLQVARDEHHRRKNEGGPVIEDARPTIEESKQHVRNLRRQRRRAENSAALEDYTRYLNNKYGSGWHPGLILPEDSDVYYKLLADAGR